MALDRTNSTWYTLDMYKVVIFDFFGVFCPDITMDWFKQAVLDYESKLADLQAICTRSDYGKISRADFFKEVSILAGVSIESMQEGVEAQVIINTELVAFVEQLRQSGYKIACLSNGTHEWTLRVISDHGLGRLFDEITLSGDLGLVKPSPEIYLQTIAKFNINPGEAVFVDDRQINVDAAKRLGMGGLLFTDTVTFIKEFEDLTTILK